MGVITGAVAIIRYNGIPIGKMKGISVNENISRGNVQGLGNLISLEKPALSWAGTVSCDMYNVSLKEAQIPDSILRNVQTVQEWIDSVVLQEEGITLDIFQKVPRAGQPKIGLILGEEKPYAKLGGLFLNTQGFDINEGSISGQRQSFDYLFPIIYPQ